MIGYVTTAVGMLITSVGAIMFAAKGVSDMVAIFLSPSDSVDRNRKRPSFRKKRKFHLLMFAKLNALRANLHLKKLNTDEASQEYASTMSLYASESRMAPRERDWRAIR
jgi:hypothetical protein